MPRVSAAVSTLIRAPMAWLGPGRLQLGAAVAVDGRQITYAGSQAGAPDADEILELDGFLMPAIADRHAHVAFAEPGAIVMSGVTAVRDLGWPADEILPLAEASESPNFAGPLIRAGGPILTARGGYPVGEPYAPPGFARELDGPEDAASVVADLVARGASHIKVALNSDAGPTPTDQEVAAVCQAAADNDIPVTVHAEGNGQVERALGAGASELAHAPFSEPLSERLLETLARSLRIVSTLDMLRLEHDPTVLRVAAENLARFHRFGGRIVYGTDFGDPDWGLPHGIDIDEAMLLGEVGLTGDEVLEAMALGPLEPGAPADMLGLPANPLDDARAFEEPLLVMRGGHLFTAMEDA